MFKYFNNKDLIYTEYNIHLTNIFLCSNDQANLLNR